MTCDVRYEHELIREVLPLAGAGALELEELERVERHAQGCEDCRRELEKWSRYAQALRQLPQPSVPEGLLERTQARMLQQKRAATTRDCVDSIVLGAIAIVGWATGLVMWALVRGFTDGALKLGGLNLLNPISWLLLSAVLTWIATAASALVSVRYRETRIRL
jgi:anti-sigma factor RsiW